MNVIEATTILAKRCTGKRTSVIAAQVQQTIFDCAPRKPFDKDTAKSMYLLNDIGGLVSGDIDTVTDMPWLTNDVIRALWNQANRMTGKI